MQAEPRIIGLSLGFGLLGWVVDAAVDFLIFYDGTFIDLLVTDVPPHELYIRFFILGAFLVFGIIASGLNARLKEREETLAKQHDTVRALHDVALGIEESDTPEEVYERLVEAAEDILEFDIAIADAAKSGKLIPKAVSAGLSEEQYYTETPIDSNTNIAASVYRTGEPSIIDDLRTRSVQPADTEYLSALTVPIGEFGVFQAVSSELGAFDTDDLEHAELLVAHARTKLTQLEANHELQTRTATLERQNERLDKFASVLSHDLRNPLTVARGHLTLHREHCDAESELEDVSLALDRMESLIDDILSATRFGQPVQEPETVSLSTLLEGCWEIVDTPTASLDIVDEVQIRGDPERLKRLFENLFRNAVDHGGEDVTVRVGTIDANGLYVADDGLGIPESEREQVFEWGYTTGDSGTGLGLSIVKEIADAHDWRISVTESESGGARIEFTDVVVVDSSATNG